MINEAQLQILTTDLNNLDVYFFVLSCLPDPNPNPMADLAISGWHYSAYKYATQTLSTLTSSRWETEDSCPSNAIMWVVHWDKNIRTGFHWNWQHPGANIKRYTVPAARRIYGSLRRFMKDVPLRSCCCISSLRTKIWSTEKH